MIFIMRLWRKEFTEAKVLRAHGSLKQSRFEVICEEIGHSLQVLQERTRTGNPTPRPGTLSPPLNPEPSREGRAWAKALLAPKAPRA